MNNLQRPGVEPRMAAKSWRQAAWAGILVAALAPDVRAQEPPGGGMGQGEALINVRSDVKLGIKGTGGTTSERLQQLADAVADRMGEVRACYGEIVKRRPSATGELAIRLELGVRGAAPTVEAKEKGPTDPELAPCVIKAIAGGKYGAVGRPAAGIITLDFENSRARGQSLMAVHQAELAAVEVRASSGGGFEATWSTHGDEVTFTVRGDVEKAVDAVTRALRARFAGFVDCRRRARKGDRSPAGVTKVALRVAQGGSLEADVESTTVEYDQRTVPCVDKAFDKLVAEGAPVGRRLNVDVTFAP